jgi:hypothetical protein
MEGRVNVVKGIRDGRESKVVNVVKGIRDGRKIKGSKYCKGSKGWKGD